MTGRPHLIFLAIGFPPAAKSSTYRLREIANQFCGLGWDVTVVNIAKDSWKRDYGLDHSLSSGVDRRIKVVELPLVRKDLETDIRTYSKKRALDPWGWQRDNLVRTQKDFPEPHYGSWKRPLIKAVEAIHSEHPADLLLASCVPYVLLSVARHMFERHGVPYSVDFRDGWSIDVVEGVEAFDRHSRQGRLEQTILADALALWVVNEPIAMHYRRRYPEIADRVHVVRNGFDPESQPPSPRQQPPQGAPLTFGYLGSVNFRSDVLREVLQGWRLARESDPLLADARFELRGHVGAGANREANGITEALGAAAADGVSFGGAVSKGDVPALYDRWDVLILMLIGGRYVTSGKVYEYMATGLPIVSAHAAEHDASTVLQRYPLWTGAEGVEVETMARLIRSAAQLARQASAADRQAARACAAQFDRAAMMAPAVQDLAALALSRKRATGSTGDGHRKAGA
ncbi:hypothetical protein GCM10009841_23030 [Microlunatus panaciterrae]|uniref:Glycosyltransferase involved in cell wall biosynthesis n=1 Tax=Microlunatus panaciterrae TaxID=400768 RepID=A0ABS2RDX0_9ACTN|nr:glycosyltransferase [Microlunatus panaciterrae]MBM7797185.1 glycosyltransferase involved in cell wall biosynthesis [Microlunatus panaciterrae]